jgi:hypothetical protein
MDALPIPLFGIRHDVPEVDVVVVVDAWGPAAVAHEVEAPEIGLRAAHHETADRRDVSEMEESSSLSSASETAVRTWSAGPLPRRRLSIIEGVEGGTTRRTSSSEKALSVGTREASPSEWAAGSEGAEGCQRAAERSGPSAALAPGGNTEVSARVRRCTWRSAAAGSTPFCSKKARSPLSVDSSPKLS